MKYFLINLQTVDVKRLHKLYGRKVFLNLVLILLILIKILIILILSNPNFS